MADEYMKELYRQMTKLQVSLTNEQMENIIEAFAVTDTDKSGFIEKGEIFEAFQATEAKPPQYKIRQCLSKYDSNNDQKLSIEEFAAIYSEVCPTSMKNTFVKAIQKKSGIVELKSRDKASAEGTQHSYSHEERIAFCNWINQNLASDPDLVEYKLPIQEEDETKFFESLIDGVILCKLVNFSQEGTIDRRAINLKKSTRKEVQVHKDQENLNLALNSASAIGCNIVNIGAQDIKEGRAHLVMGMLWQVIRIGLFSAINLEMCPELAVLVNEEAGETLEDFLALPPEKILLRWMNYHLQRSEAYKGMPEITNFSGDIKNSKAYLCLLEQIEPISEEGDKQIYSNLSKHPGDDRDSHLKRANQMLKEADKIGCRAFVSETDVVKGNSKLNMAFVANLFNKHPALEAREPVEEIKETMEEKTYRNWMNSIGVSPRVNRMYKDLRDGLVFLQLYKQINPSIVEDARIQRDFTKLGGNMKKLENCNYVIELGKKSQYSLVGIGGKDIMEATNTSFTLALTWQLMRGYTLNMLKELMGDEFNMKKIEPTILQWANQKLADAGKKSTITSFKDKKLNTSIPILDLCDSIQEDAIDYANVSCALDEDSLMDNARYTISMCRKIGARVYTLPEDITNLNSKMIMTLFACLMTRDMRNKK